MNAICLITLRPNNIWCNFLNSFRKYQIFIIIDDNEFDCTFLKNKYTNITFIQINSVTGAQHANGQQDSDL